MGPRTTWGHLKVMCPTWGHPWTIWGQLGDIITCPWTTWGHLKAMCPTWGHQVPMSHLGTPWGHHHTSMDHLGTPQGHLSHLGTPMDHLGTCWGHQVSMDHLGTTQGHVSHLGPLGDISRLYVPLGDTLGTSSRVHGSGDTWGHLKAICPTWGHPWTTWGHLKAICHIWGHHHVSMSHLGTSWGPHQVPMSHLGTSECHHMLMSHWGHLGDIMACPRTTWGHLKVMCPTWGHPWTTWGHHTCVPFGDTLGTHLGCPGDIVTMSHLGTPWAHFGDTLVSPCPRPIWGHPRDTLGTHCGHTGDTLGTPSTHVLF